MTDNDREFFTQNDEFLWHELLDRTHCVFVMLDQIVCKHELGERPEIAEHISKAIEALGDLYTKIGDIRFDVAAEMGRGME